MNDEDNGLISTDWRAMFDESQLTKINFNSNYTTEFSGLDCRDMRKIIAVMASVLDTYASKLAEYQEKRDDGSEVNDGTHRQH